MLSVGSVGLTRTWKALLLGCVRRTHTFPKRWPAILHSMAQTEWPTALTPGNLIRLCVAGLRTDSTVRKRVNCTSVSNAPYYYFVAWKVGRAIRKKTVEQRRLKIIDSSTFPTPVTGYITIS